MDDKSKISVVFLSVAVTLIIIITTLNIITLITVKIEKSIQPEYIYLDTMEYDIAGYEKSLYVIQYLKEDKVVTFEVRGIRGRDTIYENIGYIEK